MGFSSFYDRLKERIEKVGSLEELTIRKNRIIISNKGLPFKKKDKYLVPYHYNKTMTHCDDQHE